MSDTFLDALIGSIDARARHSPAESPPVAVLWPDHALQWQPIAPLVRLRRLVLELGDYDPSSCRGPAYWIRGVIDGLIEVARPDDGSLPIVYLPGYGRSDIRAVEDADASLKPVADLQYRGTIFAQQNGRDWTIGAYLQSKAGGLGVDVADDPSTKEALLRARVELCAQEVDELHRRAPLRARYFDSLLAPDLDRDVLSWLNDPQAFQASLDAATWTAFRSRFKDAFGLDLDDGEIAVAGQLGRQAGAWAGVWTRYAEAPDRYPVIEEQLRAAAPKRVRDKVGLFDGPVGAWPQDNDEGEQSLRRALADVSSLGPAVAADRIRVLEAEHAERREWVWAELGQAPLAVSLEHLAALANATGSAIAFEPVPAMVEAYAAGAWRADDAVMRALAAVVAKADRDVVAGVIRAVYTAWLDEGARRFQEAVGEAGSDYLIEPLVDWDQGTCLVFIDGLRFDVGRRVEAALQALGCAADLRPRLSALPTITSTAKPAVSPVVASLGPGGGLGPAPRAGGADLAIAGLRSLLQAEGYQVLQDGETGDSTGRAWTEHGDIDELGHKQQAKLPALLDGEVRSVCERVTGLLDAGWMQVVVVTDHGWLYLPGGLPKVELPYYLTKDERMKKGRTGRLADGAIAPGGTVPWYWDPSVRMAVAPGIAAFVAGSVYEHGGVSPQECVTPVITVTADRSSPRSDASITVVWQGLRARIAVDGAKAGWTADLRTAAGDPSSSIVGGARSLDDEGNASAPVEDDDLIGSAVVAVVIESSGRLIAQVSTTVGGDD